MRRRWWMAGVAAAVVVAAVGAGAVVMAQDSTQNGGTSFLDRVAQKLGIDTPKLQDAVKSASKDEIDARVASGDLTQQQADALKSKIDQSNGAGKFGFGFGPGGRGDEHGFKFGVGPDMGANLNDLATFLGTTSDQLKTELQAQNATLATVAQAHGKSRDDLKSFIADKAKARLDQAVTDQKITQKRADEELQELRDHLDALIDNAFPGKHGKPGMRHMMPANPNMPNNTPSTPSQSGTSLRGVFSS